MSTVEWATLGLGYLQALVWPGVGLTAVLLFRREIAAKIQNLHQAKAPGVEASFFEQKANAVETKAELAAKRDEAKAASAATQEDAATVDSQVAPKDEGPATAPSKPTVSREHASRRAREEAHRRLEEANRFPRVAEALEVLNSPPDYSGTLAVADVSPTAGVLTAYASLERVARAALTLDALGLPSRRASLGLRQIVRHLTTRGLESEFADVADGLAELRNDVAHGSTNRADPSRAGAFDFIVASERLSSALVALSLSKWRHPSRAPFVREWQEWAEVQGLLPSAD